MALNKIDTAAIAADAVDSSILDLSDNYTFTGTIAGAGGGKVLQVKHSFIKTSQSTTSSSFVDSNLSETITLASTSNKVLVVVSVGRWYVTTGTDAFVTVYRDTTNIGDGTYGLMGCRNQAEYTPSTTQILDSPASTSQIEYSVYYRVQSGTTYVSHSTYGHFGITLMEIEG